MVLASLLIAALLLFLFLPRNKGAFRALPAQSALVLDCKGLLWATVLIDKTSDPNWRAVLQSPLFERCFEDMDAALQLFRQEPAPLRLHLRPAALAGQFRNQMDPRWRELPDLQARNLEWLGLSWDGQS